MSSNTDIIDLISSEASQAVDQIIEDSGRLHTVVNGTGLDSAITEDGSLIPSVRKALLENFYFKTPVLPWRNGGTVTVFNQLYSFTESTGITAWWYAPSATMSTPVVMGDSPLNDTKFRLFMDKTALSDLYAPITSPNFKGNPQAPTPPQGDNSQTIPNTSWVQTELDLIRQQVVPNPNGQFTNINVSNRTTTKDLTVTGTASFNGAMIEALNSLLKVKYIELPSSASYLRFTTPETPPLGINKKTELLPFAINTGTVTANRATFDILTAGTELNNGISVDLRGNAIGDYLRLQGNSNNPADRPQLVVEGIAEINTLRVQNLEGFEASIDGKDIKPNSVEATTFVKGQDLQATRNLSVGEKTTVKDLVITGTVTGLDVDVDGQDIYPKSVTTDETVNVGTNLLVGVNATIANDLTVNGKTVLKDLEITGDVTGIDLDVTGQDLGPNSVTATTFVNAQTINAPLVNTDTLSADRIDITPKIDTTTSAVYIPDGNSSLYDITLTQNITLSAPAGLISSGKGGSVIIYISQDNTGGRTLTLSSDYVKIGEGDIDITPNSTTILQLMYRGSGNLIDVIVAPRR